MKCELCLEKKDDDKFVCSDCHIDDNNELRTDLQALKNKLAVSDQEVKDLKIRLHVLESLVRARLPKLRVRQ